MSGRRTPRRNQGSQPPTPSGSNPTTPTRASRRLAAAAAAGSSPAAPSLPSVPESSPGHDLEAAAGSFAASPAASSPLRYATSPQTGTSPATNVGSAAGDEDMDALPSVADPFATPRRRRRDLGITKADGRQFNASSIGQSDAGHGSEAGSTDSDPGLLPTSASDGISGSTSGHGSAIDPNLVIWGTDIVIADVRRKLTKFIKTFCDSTITYETAGYYPNKPLYLQKMAEMAKLEVHCLDVDCEHVAAFDPQLKRQIICNPQEIIPAFDMAVTDLFNSLYPDTPAENGIIVRPFFPERTNQMRELNPEDIDQLVTISGMVIRSSTVIPEMRQALFECNQCGQTETVDVERGVIASPTVCSKCNTNHCLFIVHNRCLFDDKQIIKVQESPDDMPAGQTPTTIVMHAHGELVDSVQAGDRVLVTGIYRATPLRVNPRMRNLKAVFRAHIDVLHFQVKNTHASRAADSHKGGFTDDRIEYLKKIAATVQFSDTMTDQEKNSKFAQFKTQLCDALAPSIYENEDVKFGILCQLFGGTRKDMSKSGRSEARSEINILLCGDPGTSKSQLLQYVHKLVPRGQYTSGKGSSAAGLTASVTKDPDSGQLVLQTGALVLSDNGVCCIDEFDKMSDSCRAILHEAMEQQSISIAKAGIICSLQARTSILAAANPVDSKWNHKKSIVENVQLPHTLLSRFDLIFLVIDPQNEEYDRQLAHHLVSLYHTQGEDNQAMEFFDLAVLRDYMAYAKENIFPRLEQEAANRLIEIYVNMRKIGSDRGMITAYPRQLESLIRLSEGVAKMRYSPKVQLFDVEEAYGLYRAALKQAAIDPNTGEIDVAQLYEGQTASERRRRTELADEIRALIQSKHAITFKRWDVFEELNSKREIALRRDLYIAALRNLQDDEFITQTGEVLRVIS